MSMDKKSEWRSGSDSLEPHNARDARMAWWREAKFGMFIHWGVYSVLAGDYKGKGGAEWIMKAAEIPVDEYRSVAKEFTAEHYDPEAWADLAVKAGMRYIVITSKHHDGFALYPSEVTDWNVADATPCGKDLLAPLAKAARDRGLKFGLYYSHAQDWMHPGGAKHNMEEDEGWDDAHRGSFDEYLRTIAVPQVKEILTRYQPDVLWYDTPVHMTPERAELLAGLRELSPGIIVNDRLGGGYGGDTETPENFIPPAGFPDGRDWETCMTMNDNWGYVRADHDWKSFRRLIGYLVDVASKGGNFLLNVGPDGRGVIPQQSVELLTRIGAWLEVNGESIYGTQATPFARRIPWGRCTARPDGENTIIYLHLLNRPDNGRLLLPGLQNRILSVKWLDMPESLTVESTKHGPVVLLSSQCSSVIRMLVEGEPRVLDIPVLADPDDVIRLTPMDARLKGALTTGQVFDLDRIGGWENTDDIARWNVEAQRDGRFTVILRATTPGEKVKLVVSGSDVEFNVEVQPTKRWRRDYLEYDLGTLQLRKGQRFEMSIAPERKNPNPVYVNSLDLVFTED